MAPKVKLDPTANSSTNANRPSGAIGSPSATGRSSTHGSPSLNRSPGTANSPNLTGSPNAIDNPITASNVSDDSGEGTPVKIESDEDTPMKIEPPDEHGNHLPGINLGASQPSNSRANISLFGRRSPGQIILQRQGRLCLNGPHEEARRVGHLPYHDRYFAALLHLMGAPRVSIMESSSMALGRLMRMSQSTRRYDFTCIDELLPTASEALKLIARYLISTEAYSSASLHNESHFNMMQSCLSPDCTLTVNGYNLPARPGLALLKPTFSWRAELFSEVAYGPLTVWEGTTEGQQTFGDGAVRDVPSTSIYYETELKGWSMKAEEPDQRRVLAVHEWGEIHIMPKIIAEGNLARPSSELTIYNLTANFDGYHYGTNLI